MNTHTGNIFSIDGSPLEENEVELTPNEFAELFPIRDLKERLHRYQETQQRPAAFDRCISETDQPTALATNRPEP
jgi:hypothetical protein